jgi:catalase (peroxidase I)
MLEKMSILLCFAALLPGMVDAACPFAGSHKSSRVLPDGHPQVPGFRSAIAEYQKAAAIVDWAAVKEDVITLLDSSQDFWPADELGIVTRKKSYTGLFVRLAWHCSGSYRESDGRGGCEGGRQRFEPELSWADNANLIHAHQLLMPIKVKHGLGLSWGDLYILAGSTAIEHAGGPVLGFCAGRYDDSDGGSSVALGANFPWPEVAQWQTELYPCLDKEGNPTPSGNCSYVSGLGASTIGLIYVNPEGKEMFPGGTKDPKPEESVPDIRDTFARMSMNDSETASLIGGGHTFGKAHGACNGSAGDAPIKNPIDPYHGTCGNGLAPNVYTSGLEVQWTSEPFQWDNEYWQNLVNYTWERHVGPGGHFQMRIKPGTPGSDDPVKSKLGMFLTDVALTKDPVYLELVKKWATPAGFDDFSNLFSHSWYKLTARDRGPYRRCMEATGAFPLPPAQDWQEELPPPTNVSVSIVKGLAKIISDEIDAGGASSNDLIRMAFQCASTFRHTDSRGGCNGARILNSPQKDFELNKDLVPAVKKVLDKFHEQFDKVSYADLIVLAGTVAASRETKSTFLFCPGRSDVNEGPGSYASTRDRVNRFPPAIHDKENIMTAKASTLTFDRVRDAARIMGITDRQLSALYGGAGLGLANAPMLDDSYLKSVEAYRYGSNPPPPKDANIFDMTFIYYAQLSSVAQAHSADHQLFVDDFVDAWTWLMNADRFEVSCNDLENTIMIDAGTMANQIVV